MGYADGPRRRNHPGAQGGIRRGGPETAQDLGAKPVNVREETIVKPVETGTNDAAVRSFQLDIPAHRGLIQLGEARPSAENKVNPEASVRDGYSFANGQVVAVAREAGAELLPD